MKQIITISMAILLMAGTTNAQNVPNGGFETWTILAPGIEQPQGWFTLNFFAVLGAPVTALKSTDKRSGNFSLQLKAVEDDGEIIGGIALSSIAVTRRPQRISGWYKFTRTNPTDSALATLYASKFNGVSGQSDPIGYAEAYLGPATQWTQFTATMEYIGTATPDSASVVLLASSEDFIADAWFDDITIEYSGTNVEPVMPVVGNAKLFPNPAKGITTLEFFSHHDVEFQVKLIESTGKIHRLSNMQPFSAGNNSLELNLEGVSPGVHFIHISNGTKSQMLKITVL